MKNYIIFAARAISYVLIPIFALSLGIGLIRLHVPGSGVTYNQILFDIIILLTPVAIIMLLHSQIKQKQHVHDLKMVGALILIGLLPLIVLFSLLDLLMH